jgi:hypothetical protein
VFEPAPVADAPRQYQQTTPMYVFAPLRGGAVAAKESRDVELRLFGSAVRYLPFVVHAMTAAGRGGIGSTPVPFTHTATKQWQAGDWCAMEQQPSTPDAVPAMPKRIALRMYSPLRLKRDGHYLTPKQFDASSLLMALLRRCYTVHLGDGILPDVDWQAWQQRATAVQLIAHDVQWEESARRSSRHGYMRAGGIVGKIELYDVDSCFWPLLWAGQWLQLGHMACMGLGAYRIEAV